MGFRFRKSIKLAPGVRLNLNTKSTSLTLGGKHMKTTINKKRKTVTRSVRTPIKGLYYSNTAKIGGSNKRNSSTKNAGKAARSVATNKHYTSANTASSYKRNPASAASVPSNPERNKKCAALVGKVFLGFFIFGLLSTKDVFAYAMVFSGVAIWYAYQYFQANRKLSPEQLERLAYYAYPDPNQKYTSVMVYRKAKKLETRIPDQVKHLENQIALSQNYDLEQLLMLISDHGNLRYQLYGIQSILAEPAFLPQFTSQYETDCINHLIDREFQKVDIDARASINPEEAKSRYQRFFDWWYSMAKWISAENLEKLDWMYGEYVGREDVENGSMSEM